MRGTGANCESVTPHPASRTASASHPLPQGEREEIARAPHRPFHLQLSNSQASSSSLRKSARAQFVFRLAPRRGASSLPKREQSAVGRTRDACPLRRSRRRPCEAGSPYGAPLRRLNPWCPTSFAPAFAGGGSIRDIHPGPHNGPGGCHPRTPGTAVSETAGAGAAPHPRSVRLGTPLCGWG